MGGAGGGATVVWANAKAGNPQIAAVDAPTSNRPRNVRRVDVLDGVRPSYLCMEISPVLPIFAGIFCMSLPRLLVTANMSLGTAQVPTKTKQREA
jgi:hypothetical protein